MKGGGAGTTLLILCCCILLIVGIAGGAYAALGCDETKADDTNCFCGTDFCNASETCNNASDTCVPIGAGTTEPVPVGLACLESEFKDSAGCLAGENKSLTTFKGPSTHCSGNTCTQSECCMEPTQSSNIVPGSDDHCIDKDCEHGLAYLSNNETNICACDCYEGYGKTTPGIQNPCDKTLSIQELNWDIVDSKKKKYVVDPETPGWYCKEGYYYDHTDIQQDINNICQKCPLEKPYSVSGSNNSLSGCDAIDPNPNPETGLITEPVDHIRALKFCLSADVGNWPSYLTTYEQTQLGLDTMKDNLHLYTNATCNGEVWDGTQAACEESLGMCTGADPAIADATTKAQCDAATTPGTFVTTANFVSTGDSPLNCKNIMDYLNNNIPNYVNALATSPETRYKLSEGRYKLDVDTNKIQCNIDSSGKDIDDANFTEGDSTGKCVRILPLDPCGDSVDNVCKNDAVCSTSTDGGIKCGLDNQTNCPSNFVGSLCHLPENDICGMSSLDHEAKSIMNEPTDPIGGYKYKLDGTIIPRFSGSIQTTELGTYEDYLSGGDSIQFKNNTKPMLDSIRYTCKCDGNIGRDGRNYMPYMFDKMRNKGHELFCSCPTGTYTIHSDVENAEWKYFHFPGPHDNKKKTLNNLKCYLDCGGAPSTRGPADDPDQHNFDNGHYYINGDGIDEENIAQCKVCPASENEGGMNQIDIATVYGFGGDSDFDTYDEYKKSTQNQNNDIMGTSFKNRRILGSNYSTDYFEDLCMPAYPGYYGTPMKKDEDDKWKELDKIYHLKKYEKKCFTDPEGVAGSRPNIPENLTMRTPVLPGNWGKCLKQDAAAPATDDNSENKSEFDCRNLKREYIHGDENIDTDEKLIAKALSNEVTSYEAGTDGRVSSFPGCEGNPKCMVTCVKDGGTCHRCPPDMQYSYCSVITKGDPEIPAEYDADQLKECTAYDTFINEQVGSGKRKEGTTKSYPDNKRVISGFIPRKVDEIVGKFDETSCEGKGIEWSPPQFWIGDICNGPLGLFNDDGEMQMENLAAPPPGGGGAVRQPTTCHAPPESFGLPWAPGVSERCGENGENGGYNGHWAAVNSVEATDYCSSNKKWRWYPEGKWATIGIRYAGGWKLNPYPNGLDNGQNIVGVSDGSGSHGYYVGCQNNVNPTHPDWTPWEMPT